jgi:hypothetical protein
MHARKARREVGSTPDAPIRTHSIGVGRDERHDYRPERSSSAAKKPAALRISLARRSSRAPFVGLVHAHARPLPGGQGVDRSCPPRHACRMENWGFMATSRMGDYELASALASVSA